MYIDLHWCPSRSFIVFWDDYSIVELWQRHTHIYFRIRKHLKDFPVWKWIILDRGCYSKDNCKKNKWNCAVNNEIAKINKTREVTNGMSIKG
jgi:hypothetical protein